MAARHSVPWSGACTKLPLPFNEERAEHAFERKKNMVRTHDLMPRPDVTRIGLCVTKLFSRPHRMQVEFVMPLSVDDNLGAGTDEGEEHRTVTEHSSTSLAQRGVEKSRAACRQHGGHRIAEVSRQ